MKIATIARNPLDSPNMVENDSALLHSIEKEFVAMGHHVERVDEKDSFCGYDAICNMTRTRATLHRLKEVESNGCIVINTPVAVERCSRDTFTKILDNNGIQQPPHKTIETIADIQTLSFPGWIKKCEGWSHTKEDVVYVVNTQEAINAFNTINNRGHKALFCTHIEGDIIKFYAVKELFFTYTYPQCDKTKFGHEKINGAPAYYPFDSNKLKKDILNAASAIGLEIYGGDAIITPTGDIYIIDINDFPSFSAVRDIAAQHIAQAIIDKIEKNEYRR